MNIDTNKLAEEVVAIIKKRAPKDTCNLAYNSIRVAWFDNSTFQVFVDESIAPYMVYTNEPWISPKWNGKKNPNEAWWQSVVEEITQHIITNYGGTVE